MKKSILIAAGLASALAFVPVTQAASVGGNFNVTVSLTSVCTMGTVSELAFGTYIAYQTGIQTATPTTANLSCTRGLTGITAAFDTVTTNGATAAAPATNAVGAGVLAGLQYDITATQGTITTGTAATASSIGTSANRAYTISGTMPSAQAGDSSALLTQTRTLTITY